MPLPALEFIPLGADPAKVVDRVPASPGVGQFLGPEGHSLLLAPAANLRRWARAHLGLGKPPAPDRRPKTNLTGVATSVGWARTPSPFAQRLLYERLMAPLVPPSARRDLKPPAFLHLDPAQRFPRVTVREVGNDEAALHGPFRNRRAAERARDTVNRLFALRPCDFVFEPDPALPLGLGCLYAQVRSCAAPCLARVSEEQYRAIAARAAGWLADPTARVDPPAEVAPSVAAVAGHQAVVVDAGRREIGLYPVRAGRVLDSAATVVPPSDLDDAVRRLEWPEVEREENDWAWLAVWISSPRGRGSYLLVRDEDRETLVTAVRAALPARFARPLGGGNVGTSRGEA